MNSGDSLENYLFGPLDKRYCLLFYIFSILGFFAFFVALVGVVVSFARGTKKLTATEVFFVVYSLLMSFLVYLQNRLLYSMCVNTNLPEQQ
jgi:asparagine N-glycosylation enzyme membrane subunit Stt3